MRKKTVKVMAFCTIVAMGNLRAQFVGINTTTPKVTLDVMGNPEKPTQLDGILAPRITGNQLKEKVYGLAQKGALLYVTEPAANTQPETAQTKYVVDKGYYYFDGDFWIPFREVATDSLFDVVQRGNYAGRFISFTGDANTKEGDRTSALGYDGTTKSFFFGNLNPSNTGKDNVAIGLNTGSVITGGYSNTLVGNDAGRSIVGAFENTLIGKDAGRLLKSGQWNVAIGESAMYDTADATYTTSIGDGAAMNTVGRLYNNTVVGANAFRASAGKNNTILGAHAGFKIEGDNNVFIGSGAGEWIASSTRTKLSNKLIIHSSKVADDGSNGGGGTYLENIGTNSLIFGDFAERWFRLNGVLQLNPAYVSTVAPVSGKMLLLYDPVTGNVEKTSLSTISVPAPPSSGTFVLKSIGGIMVWISE